MAIDTALLALLACPSDDHAPLRDEQFDGVECWCARTAGPASPFATASRCCCSTTRAPGPHGLGNAAS